MNEFGVRYAAVPNVSMSEKSSKSIIHTFRKAACCTYAELLIAGTDGRRRATTSDERTIAGKNNNPKATSSKNTKDV